jgi:hypothetical protein
MIELVKKIAGRHLPVKTMMIDCSQIEIFATHKAFNASIYYCIIDILNGHRKNNQDQVSKWLILEWRV